MSYSSFILYWKAWNDPCKAKKCTKLKGMRSICDFSDRKTEFLIPQKRRDQHQYYLLLTWNSLPLENFRLSFKILLWFTAETYKKCTEQVFLLILRVYESPSSWKRKVMLVLSWLTGLIKKHQSGIVESPCSLFQQRSSL